MRRSFWIGWAIGAIGTWVGITLSEPLMTALGFGN